MVELITLPNGDLKIKVTDKKEFNALSKKHLGDERNYLWEMLDYGYIGNDWHVPFGLGLTEVPAIAMGALYENDDAEQPNDFEKLWIYDNYMITSYMKDLRKKGHVIFHLVN